MKWLITGLLVALPAAAQAMGMHGGGGPGGACGTHLGTVLYAGLAVLGYWVLQHADKDTRALIKYTGQVVAWALIVLGLLGFLCGIGSHIMSAASKCAGKCPSGMMGGGQGGGQGGGGWQQEQPAQAEEVQAEKIKSK